MIIAPPGRGISGNTHALLIKTATSATFVVMIDVFADVMKKPEDGFDFFAPENVAPLVVWLGSEQSASVTGRLFEVEGGKISLADGWRRGPEKDKGNRWEPAEIGGAVAELIAEAVPAQKIYGS